MRWLLIDWQDAETFGGPCHIERGTGSDILRYLGAREIRNGEVSAYRQLALSVLHGDAGRAMDLANGLHMTITDCPNVLA